MQSHYLVIGAGSAGVVLTRRLLDAGNKVTLVEAGGQDTNADIDDVSRLGMLWGGAEDWNYFTTPQPQLNDRRVHVPRGKVMGGSHALNATIWVRGDRRDFDTWAEQGCQGWSWDDVLPFYKAIENFHAEDGGGGDSQVHGTQGPLDVTYDYPRHPIQQAMYDATLQAGVPANPDYNSGSVEGAGWMQLNVRDGVRFNTWRAYLKPIADHEDLTLITEATARRLLLEGLNVTGAEFSRDGEIFTVEADEVILTAGAIGSPELMLRSGLGPREHLEELGLAVIKDIPAVGKNLHDHLLVPVVCTTQDPLPMPEVAAAQVHFFAKSIPDLPVADTQPIFFSLPMYTNSAEPLMEGPETGFSLLAGLVRPKSRGTLTLAGPAPGDGVNIDLAAYAQEDDLQAMLYSLKQCRDIAAQPALRQHGAVEVHPGREVQSEEELIEYIRRTTTTYHHQVGTCAMGIGPTAVVDPQSLRVHGVQGLRIADASVMPQVTTGNTNAPSVLIGERCATAITGLLPFEKEQAVQMEKTPLS